MTHALLLSALLPFVSPGSQDPAEAARLVPADAFLTVRVESAARLHALAARFARMGGDEVPADAAALLRDMDVPGDAAQIDVARPAYVAFSLGNGGMAPAPTFVVPVRDAQAYAASLAEDATLQTAVSGGYVGISTVPGYAAAGSDAALATLRPGLISASLDLATLIKTFRPMIEMGLDQVEMMMDQMAVEQDAAMDMGALMEVYVDGLWAFVDSADQLDLVFEFDGTLLQQRVWLSTLADSPMAKLGGEGSFDLRPAAAFVDPEAGFGMLMACDMVKTTERFDPWLDMLLDAYPPEIGAEIERLVDAYRPLLPLLGPTFAASGDMGSGGMRIAYSLPCADPAKLSESMRELLASAAAGPASQAFAIGAPEEIELAGGKALRARLTFDVESLTEMSAPGEDVGAEELEQLATVMESLYGDGNLPIVWRAMADRVAVALGGDDAFAAAALNARPRPSDGQPAELRGAVEAASGGALGLVYRIDYARIFSDMAPMFASMGVDEFGSLSDKDLRMPITVWMKVAGTTWSGGASLRMDQLESVVQAFTAAAAEHSGAGEDEDR
jgi:hypothetical protein